MIDRLITMLQEARLLNDQEIDREAQSLLDDEDIADALWLATKIGGAYTVEAEEASEADEAATSAQTPIQVIDADTELAALPPTASVYMPPAVSSEPQSIATPEQGLPIQIQAAPALPDARNIWRSLRPLMRKVPSRTRSELNATATVDQIAERDIWVPILKPSLERWFDLELVIEASPFSFIWQETLDEFQRILEGQGAFRQVRAWYVQEDEGEPKLVAKKQNHRGTELNGAARSPKELIDASGRRLVLVVSDCRSHLWRQGQIHDWLRLWGQHGPAAIVQLLPERLWRQSELDVGFAVQVGALTPGQPNPKLQVRALPARTQIAAVEALTLPVVTLTAKALKQWALVVAAAGRQRMPARLFDLAWVKDSERDRSRDVFQPRSPQARLELFEATASPLAQQLARKMAAVPVELPVVYLIQQELLKALQPEHIAEVYDSVLLEEKPDSSQNGLSVRYDFVEGVRELLNRSTPIDETIDVMEALSRRIARTLGFEIKSFTALLSPRSGWSQETKDAILPFAQVALDVLRRLGGDYAELAELVEHDAGSRPGWGMADELDENLEGETDGEPDSEPDVSWELDTFDFITARFSVPEPEISDEPDNLTPFKFSVATFQRNTTKKWWQRKGAEWSIQRQKGNGYLWVESLSSKEKISLEMVPIPAGTFLMGSPKGEPDRMDCEDPQHEVHVPAFFMSRYPITQNQWRLVAGLQPINRELNPDPSIFKGGMHPVECISWYDAVEFCDRLSAFTQRTYNQNLKQLFPSGLVNQLELQTKVESEIPINGKGRVKFRGAFWSAQCHQDIVLSPGTLVRVIDRVGICLIVEPVDLIFGLSSTDGQKYAPRTYRLPTEAEWEYACRAGTTTPFHFGDIITAEVANYCATETYNGSPKGKYREKTTPVDQFEFANAWGLSDMHGNVFEWCQDHWHSTYEDAPTDGSAWLSDSEDARRVIRGGSCDDAPRNCRSAYRSYIYPRETYVFIGFRVVCSAPRTFS
jgi:formylglycine-generating enzyme required for sulfatase activity